jgi:hypothetical protein
LRRKRKPITKEELLGPIERTFDEAMERGGVNPKEFRERVRSGKPIRVKIKIDEMTLSALVKLLKAEMEGDGNDKEEGCKKNVGGEGKTILPGNETKDGVKTYNR